MISDARDLGEDRLDADLCIVGAGAAGITLARALAGGRLRVVLVESGGFVPDAASQALYEGEVVGHPYFPLTACRLRFFGGTTNHWVGYSRPLDALDFGERDWIPESGWPLTRSELDPHYRRAHEVLELGPYRYDAAFWTRPDGPAPLPLPPDVFASEVFQLSPPTRFGAAYREALTEAPNLQVLLHANAVEIESGAEGRHITAIRAKTLTGRELRVHARAFVLALGGIENARLLLASRSPAHPSGVGNQHDLVGRYFMEHPHLVDAFFLPVDPGLDGAFYTANRTPDGRFVGTLRLQPEVLRQEGLNDVSITFEPADRKPEAHLEAETSGGVVSLKHLVRSLRHRRVPDELAWHVWRVIRDLDDVATAGYGRSTRPAESGGLFKVFFRIEQAPNRESRVTLSEARDALGMPRSRLDWRLSEQDLASLERGHELLARELGRAGLGRVFFPKDPKRTWVRDVFGGNHHMGTTRMHPDPRAGVVDPSCRVHGISNLYVSGSSVFPTVGFANPTLTLVALALRLADHLADAL